MFQNYTHLCLCSPWVGAEGGERYRMSQICEKEGEGQKEKEVTCKSKLELTGRAKTKREKRRVNKDIRLISFHL